MKIRSNKGITLVALIITIVVLLILAGVTIGTLTSSDLIGKAKDARTETANAEANEIATLDGYFSYIKNNALISYQKAAKDDNGFLKENAEYTDGKETAVIPAGFKVSTKKTETIDETTISTGLVIKDSSGNEFVWIPVPDITKMATKIGKNYSGVLYTYDTKKSTSSAYEGSTLREPDTLSDYDGTKSYLEVAGISSANLSEDSSKNEAYFKTQIQNEFNKMAESVSKYKGFYVARYELSTTAQGKLASKAGATVTTADPLSGNMWYGLYKICKTYTNSEDSVESNMIYGCQYDAMMNWMKDKVSVTSTRISGVSRNTSSTYTGIMDNEAEDKDILNNVYDLLGGHFERTQEASETDDRVYRGGYYKLGFPASTRVYSKPVGTNGEVSTRPALYIR